MNNYWTTLNNSGLWIYKLQGIVIFELTSKFWTFVLLSTQTVLFVYCFTILTFNIIEQTELYVANGKDIFVFTEISDFNVILVSFGMQESKGCGSSNLAKCRIFPSRYFWVQSSPTHFCGPSLVVLFRIMVMAGNLYYSQAKVVKIKYVQKSLNVVEIGVS